MKFFNTSLLVGMVMGIQCLVAQAQTSRTLYSGTLEGKAKAERLLFQLSEPLETDEAELKLEYRVIEQTVDGKQGLFLEVELPTLTEINALGGVFADLTGPQDSPLYKGRLDAEARGTTTAVPVIRRVGADPRQAPDRDSSIVLETISALFGRCTANGGVRFNPGTRGGCLPNNPTPLIVSGKFNGSIITNTRGERVEVSIRVLSTEEDSDLAKNIKSAIRRLY